MWPILEFFTAINIFKFIFSSLYLSRNRSFNPASAPQSVYNQLQLQYGQFVLLSRSHPEWAARVPGPFSRIGTPVNEFWFLEL